MHAPLPAAAPTWPSWPSCRSATWRRPRRAPCCPRRLSRADAVFNLGRLGLLRGRAWPTPRPSSRRRRRTASTSRPAPRLFPEAPGLLHGLVDAGALAACWSGAGPTLLGMVHAAAAEWYAPGRRMPGRLGSRRTGLGAARRPSAASSTETRPRSSCRSRRGSMDLPVRRIGRMPRDLLHPHVRVPDERARLRAPGRPAGGRRHGRRRPPWRRPTSSCSTRAASGRTPTSASTGRWASLKELVDAKPGLQIAVGGCLAQKDRERIQEKVGWVDVVFGTHNLASAPGLLAAGSDRGPADGDPRRARARSRARTRCSAPGAVRELPYAAWVTIQTGCDNSCAFCIVPSVRGPEVSRPFDDIVAEVELLARPRRHRGDAARAERELLRARPHASPPALRRPAARRRRRRGHRPRPLHQPASEGPPARDDRGHGRDARGVRAAAPAPPVGQRPGAARPCGAATRRARYLERLAAAREAIDDLAVTTDIIVGFPGETAEDFEDTLAVCAEAAYDSAYTFIFSPRPGTRAAAMESAFVPAEVVRRALRAAQDGGRPLRPGPPPGPGRAQRGGPGRGCEPARRGHADRAHPAGEARPLPGVAGRAARPPGALARVTRHRGPSPPPLRPARGGDGAAAAPRADPGGRARDAPSPWSASPRRASPRPRSSWPVGGATARSSRSTPCACTAAWTSARPSPTRGPRAPCRTTSSTWSTRTRSSP